MIAPGSRTSPAARGRAAVALAAVLAVAGAAGGCRSTPSDLREWRPEDHDSGTSSVTIPEDDDPLFTARAVWEVQCANCHGRAGRGDGPQAAMSRPPDFASAAFQQSRDDAQLRASIANGRGAMPAFGQTLRPEAIDVLVRLVRDFARR